MKILLTILLLSLTGCGVFPEKIEMDDPKIQPLLEAASHFDRKQYGFTPIPNEADVRLEQHEEGVYHVMLHIYSKTSRTIAFLKTDTGYKWIHEQEIFKGPNKYTTVDGVFNESICLTYETGPISGHKKNALDISYSGEDPRLKNNRDILLEDVKPILKEWKY